MQEKLLEFYNNYVLIYGVKIVSAVVILIIGRIAASLLSKSSKKIMSKSGAEDMLSGFLSKLIYYTIIIFVFIAAINQLGVQTTSFIAVLGAAGLAIGMALQGSLSNFAAGVMIIMFKPFKVGDFINAGGGEGVVNDIQIFNTIITSPDNKKVIIPNMKVTGDKIINFSAMDTRRIDLVFGISYNDDIKQAKEVLADLLSADARILKDPKPTIAVGELGDSSVNLVCRPWVKPGDYWDVYFDVIEKGKIELEKNGMSIPFPQTDVHLHKSE